jgi:hypothetical protein
MSTSYALCVVSGGLDVLLHEKRVVEVDLVAAGLLAREKEEVGS